ncbi:NusG domain II-containing protein [Clostridiaceae bacterium 35-E11]
MTKWDKILIIGIILFSMSGIFFVKTMSVNDDHMYLVIEVDGKEYKKISVDPSTIQKRIKIDTNYGHSVVEIEGNSAAIVESDCPDQLCVKMGKITKVNQISICLPNRLSIKLISNKSDLDVISY